MGIGKEEERFKIWLMAETLCLLYLELPTPNNELSELLN